jgi:hypothetical protein
MIGQSDRHEDEDSLLRGIDAVRCTAQNGKLIDQTVQEYR